MPPKTKRGMWTDEMPEVVIYLVKRRTHSLRKVSKSWDMSSIIDHLNRKTRSKKMGSKGVLIEEKKCCNDEVDLRHARMWLSISLEQLKMKVTKLTQTKDTPFRNGILGNSWWD